MIQRDRNNAGALRSTIRIVLLAVAALLLPAAGASAQVPPTCPPELGTANLVDHDFSFSSCELCGVGTVRIVVENPFRENQEDIDFSNLVVSENLMTSNLEYVTGTTSFSGSNISVPADVEPVVSMGGSMLTWTPASTFVMNDRPNAAASPATWVIEFDVRYRGPRPEDLITADRDIEASLGITPSCAPGDRYVTTGGAGELPLDEPIVRIDKRGRNVDAGQGGWSNTVYGHENDDVVWRIRVINNGDAPLQDFRFTDDMNPGNFLIDYVCDDPQDALDAADGSPPSRCVSYPGGVTNITGFDPRQEFDPGANPYIVADANDNRDYFLVGRVTNSCRDRRNTVEDVQWGCQVQSPTGGILVSSTGVTPGDDELLRTNSVESRLQVNVALEGANTNQPMGTRGTVTITLDNDTRGTIMGGVGGIRLVNTLPPQYVVDTTFPPQLQVQPAYGNTYDGMVDTLEWVNFEPGTFPHPVGPGDPAAMLLNRAPEFRLTSSSPHPDHPEQYDMLRHGDVVTITFRTILIDPQYYDMVANLDVRSEAPNSNPAGTDPIESFTIDNRLDIWYEEFCNGTLHGTRPGTSPNEEHDVTIDTQSTAIPEDLDVNMDGSELLFILTSTGDPLPLTVDFTNDGGHEAADYQAYVTFGMAMVVQNAPNNCQVDNNPPLLQVWKIPDTLPLTGTVYLCDLGVVAPGTTQSLTFDVIKNPVPPFDDDLTFRADVIGEITMADGRLSYFPPPTVRPDRIPENIPERTNNYTVDGVRARMVGYDLLKTQLGTCSENNPPPGSPDVEVQIGEQCSYHVESGGWFGFETPGFTYIAVQNIQVVDENPDGQGYISSTDPLLQSTTAITGVTLDPPPVPLGEGQFGWTFNTDPDTERITTKAHWFRTDFTTRLLNDEIDLRLPPNVHAAQSSNTLTSTFEAIFYNDIIMDEELFNLGPNTIGFPREVYRRVDLTVTEPNLILTKEVCNETRYGAGPACSNFVPLADDGDAYDTYVYRVTVANEASDSNVARAPAYDVTVTSIADASDLLLVDTLTGDTLDNDGDALVDGADAAGEGQIIDNVPLVGAPAQVVASYTHSDALLRIDAGDSVVLYYRVDPNDDAAPLQRMTNTVTASYDSLEGDSGNQDPPEGVNGEIGGARRYTSQPAEAAIQIIPVEVSPKQVVRAANTALVTSNNPQPVSIGEEVEFELHALIPVAQLRSFVIRDELPPGLSCSEAPVVDLGAPPYAAAGFVPGGVFTPTCSDTEAIWDFGDQIVTQSPRADRRFDFAVRFIARVDNEVANQDGLVIRNGGTETITTVSYVNELGGAVVIPIGEAAAIVSEPLIALTKAFAVADADASDVLRVTVTATNNGSATAYNLRVLDDLSPVDLSYVGDVAGPNPPSVDLVTFGPDAPLFTWAPGAGIAPGGTLTFSFTVQVGALVEPHQVVANTIQADWTSLPSQSTALNTSGQIGPDGSPTGMRIGALPNAADALNDYEAQASASVTVPAITIVKDDLDLAMLPEIGAHKPFEVVIGLPEGATQNLALADALDSAGVSYVLTRNAGYDVSYQFDGIASINGQAPGEAAFTAAPADGTSGTATWSIGSVVTQSEDDVATQLVTPAIRIRYHARINNDLVTDAGSTLQNSAAAGYTNGETGAPMSVTDDTAPVTAIESSLTATKVLSNVTAGKAPADPPSFADTLQYVVTVVNGGNATAYEVNLVDSIPPEVELYAGFAPTAAINAVAVPGFVATPAGAPGGPLVWGGGNGDGSLDIPPGGFLELTYQVVVHTPPADGSILANSVWIDWTSRDTADAYERTGAGCPSFTAPNDYCFGPAVAQGTTAPPPPPDPLVKANTQGSAAVGEAFRYQITVPAAPYTFPMYDVRIQDDLAASGVDLRFLGVSKTLGSEPWTPVNTGTGTALVIEDPAIGIDIPAGQQITLEISVVLQDSAANFSGRTFTNTATYLYNLIDGNVASQRPGNPGTTQPMTIVGPDQLTVEKNGPTQLAIGTPATYTLDVHNPSSGRAWNLTLVDQLPDTATGGTCDVAPSGLTAGVFLNDRVTVVSGPLVEGTDFSATFLGAPDCTLSITALTAAASIDFDQRLIVSYDVHLDPDSDDGAVLTNVAGATEWFGTDGTDPQTAGDRRSYTRVINNGSVTVLDHEDAHTATVSLAQHSFEKRVVNLTSGADPADRAQPGDRLRYSLRIENLSDTPLQNFTLYDELDRLNVDAAFQPGTLTLVTVPPGADQTNTSATGGAQGTGLVDIRDLSLPGMNDSVVVEFEVTLAPVLANGSYAANQSQLRVNDVPFSDSDDPILNGSSDPGVVGDEDPTRVLIESAPAFRVQKVSSDLTGDPALLLAGETLRYTITVNNVGSDDADDARIRDMVPVNTQYVPGSTVLNGTPVADGPGSIAPLSLGIPIHAPGDPTPGVMRADASAAAGNTATLVFDVVVDSSALDGTVISNQAYVSAIGGGVVDQPSDDPGTPAPDDPTRDVVGNGPLLFASKDAALLMDNPPVGVVDPGDVLRYTIRVSNSSIFPATAAVLRDMVPADTNYMPGSVTLNGLPVADPVAGGSPLALGLPIASSDLTPPLPGTGMGTLSGGGSAVVTFDLQVDPSTPGGTIISNQAVVGTAELPDLLTDGDGNPATGPEPTLVVVGNGQQLSIAKQVAVVGGGAALPGAQLEYTVRVVNIATVPADDVVITDDLAAAGSGWLTYVPASATMNGAPVGVSLVGTVLTATYSVLGMGPLQPAEAVILRFRATLGGSLAMGTTVTNTGVVTWDTPPQSASSSVSIDVGGMPGVGVVNGAVWHDANFDTLWVNGERELEGWSVDLYRDGQPVQSVLTDAAGQYRIGGLGPNDLNGARYELRFTAPGAGSNSATLGMASSAYTNGLHTISDIVVPSGANLQNLDLPITPNGVVYDAIRRIPIAGAMLTMLNESSGTALPTACFDDPAQQNQVTLADGYYKFDLNFSDAVACPSGGAYLVASSTFGGAYAAGASQIIPPASDAATPPFSVPTCPGSAADAVPVATPQHCEVQDFASAPGSAILPADPRTAYHVHLILDGTASPGTSQIFNNHIALDPVLQDAVSISKTAASVNVSRGELVPYEITLSNQIGSPIPDLSIVDRYPAGFRYVKGSARVDGAPSEPEVVGQELVWNDFVLASSGNSNILLLLAVGAGVGEGEHVNRAQAMNSANGLAFSGEASATVRVVPDPTFACTDVLGKVYDDANRNGSQDKGEGGLQGVRLVTARGLVATTDQYGRFHITCAVVPHEARGSNFILKLDDRTLPSGYRMTTRRSQVKRATRGKALRFNYGATIDRVVGLDLADAVFEPDTSEIRSQWKARIDLLLDELGKSPATLRLSYVADIEAPGLVKQRLAAVKKQIAEAWMELDAYELEIESEVFWRRGAPPARPSFDMPGRAWWGSVASWFAGTPKVVEVPSSHAGERHLPVAEPATQWAHDPELLDTELGDRLEEREVVTPDVETVKLTDVIPPIRFESGVADIPVSSIQRLRGVLGEMQHLDNVRLHLVGHADDRPLSPQLAARYGDNEGLSRERAGEVAEYIQSALALPPESVSFSWAGDSEPIASNATDEGRALNRRVEVELWYDEIGKKLALEEVVVPEEIKRVKVCRLETVCKMRFREGHERRARVRNLIAPLHFGDGAVDVSNEFTRQVEQALHNLQDKQNVTVKFVGFTDDVPLTGRAERIYGTHLALSKARAHRVALAVKEALELPTSAVASDGRGASLPIASNATARGRSLNRRVEVEFWYDDPLQELADEPQLCPDEAGDELMTRVYDPPWGGVEPLEINGGEIELPEGYAGDLQRAMAGVEGKSNVRLRFVGYTSNERLDRRTAMVYGDDIGLSAARARRAMESVKAMLELSDEQAEHEGRGYLHSNDVVNGGFIQGDTSHVEVQVVYDELALRDDLEGIEVTPITRELKPKDPLALNLMRITVDGEPIDDPGRSSADIQRCTDVALERADIRFRFDNLDFVPRLSVTSDVGAVTVGSAEGGGAFEGAAVLGGAGAGGGAGASKVRFKAYSNYSHFFERSEVRIFDRDESLEAEPLAIVEVGPDGMAQWQPDAEWFAGPVRKLKFVLRAYDAKGRFDETAPQSLWMVHGGAGGPGLAEQSSGGDSGFAAAFADLGSEKDPLLAGYGESGPLLRNIPLGNVGTVRVDGSAIPPEHVVYLAGAPVPVDENGDFVAEVAVPSGIHTVEVAVLDPEGNGELFLRDLEFDKSDWFYTGIADFTFSANKTNGAADELQGENAQYDYDSVADGRLAFYVNGKFGQDWRLVASADTREGPVKDLFSNFVDKSPGALFRRIDPDYYYPTFGDDSIVEETAPTLGKFFVRLEKDESHAMWGNFKIGYAGNELALIERGLYGANLHYQTRATTRFGEKRVVLDGFAADPGTLPSWEEFRGTGGSLYYLRHRDILIGSERVRIEVRDKASGLVTAVVHLSPVIDYDIDWLQGRLLLSEPVSSTVDDALLVRDQGLSGNEAWVVVQYEHTPGFNDLDTLSAGGQGQFWINDYVKLGLVGVNNDEGVTNSTLYAGDLTLRRSNESWIKLQGGRSEGQVSTAFRSNDGGFDFVGTQGLGLEEADAYAYRADLRIGFGDVLDSARGHLDFYYTSRAAGYTAPGLTTLKDTDQYGGALSIPLTGWLHLGAKADRSEEKRGLETTAVEVDVDYQITDHWSLSAGVRSDMRDDASLVQPGTQELGDRTDVVVEGAFDPNGRWRGYAFGQATVDKNGDREANNRGGIGGAYRLNERIDLDGEVSYGDSGPAVKVGTSIQETEHTRRYLNYTLENERGDNGLHARRGNLVTGVKSRLSDSSSVYQENRWQHSNSSTGMSRAMGISLAPTERWRLGADWEFGTLVDRRTQAETERNAGGVGIGYSFEKVQFSSGVEYRYDETEAPDGSISDRTTWLLRNSLKLQLTPDWRLLGKIDYSTSNSSQGDFYDGGYTEAVIGYAYRPVRHDRLNALFKYTYFYNLPTTDQVTVLDTAARFIQRSHILSADLTYDLTRTLSIGGKYAYRRGEVSLDRVDPEFFDNNAHLLVLRGDWRFLKNWESSAEGRMLEMPDLDERRTGALIMIYRYFGDHFKVGVGYNFTDFSDDLTDLSYDHHGLFFNFVGSL